MARRLTIEEILIIKDYRLKSWIEGKVREVWSRTTTRGDLTLFEASAITKIVHYSFVLATIAILWLHLYLPGLVNFEKVRGILPIYFWIALPFMAIIRFIQVVLVLINKDNRFKKFALDLWKKNRMRFTDTDLAYNFLLVIGFFLNGYQETWVMLTSYFIALWFARTWIKSEVQAAMNEIAPPVNGEVIDAEYKVIQ